MEAQQQQTQAPQIPQNPVTLYPPSAMDSSIQYRLVYQPVYISDRDTNAYLAGPLLEQLPHDHEKGFFDSLTETFNIGTKKISDTIKPVAQKVSDTVAPVAQKVSDTVAPYAQKVNEKVAPVGRKLDEKVAPVAQKVGDAVTNTVKVAAEKIETLFESGKEEQPAENAQPQPEAEPKKE